jgi:hypothetical protein
MERAENIWRPLGELLVQKKLLTEDELELALAEQADTGRLLGAILVERGYVSGPALAVALAEQYGVELHTERGFGTGLWAEIDRRHRAGRGSEPEDNVVKLEAVPAPIVEIVPDPKPDPELNRLEAENRRLQDEIERPARRVHEAEARRDAGTGVLAPAVRADAGALPAGRAGRSSAAAGRTARVGARRLRGGQARRRAVPGRGSPVRVSPAAGLGG